MPLNTLTPEVIGWCRSLGSSATTVTDVINDVTLNDAIQKGIDEVNQKATSSAHRIQKFRILPTDFSIAGEELGWLAWLFEIIELGRLLGAEPQTCENVPFHTFLYLYWCSMTRAVHGVF